MSAPSDQTAARLLRELPDAFGVRGHGTSRRRSAPPHFLRTGGRLGWDASGKELESTTGQLTQDVEVAVVEREVLTGAVSVREHDGGRVARRRWSSSATTSTTGGAKAGLRVGDVG
jgi:hypothetical protein